MQYKSLLSVQNEAAVDEMLKQKMTALSERVNFLEKKISTYPNISVYPSKNGKYYNWRLKTPRNRDNTAPEKKSYLKKSDKETLLKLITGSALHEMYGAEVKELNALIGWVRNHEKNMTTREKILMQDGPYLKYLAEDNEIGNMLGIQHIPDDVWEWADSEYRKSTNHPENLIHPTDKGDLVRSKAEALIADTLFKYKIPYRYECELVLGQNYYHPDFTVYSPMTDSVWYWEHLGTMDNVAYLGNNASRFAVYAENGILPSKNLIFTAESKRSPLTKAIVEDTIAKYFLPIRQQ